MFIAKVMGTRLFTLIVPNGVTANELKLVGVKPVGNTLQVSMAPAAYLRVSTIWSLGWLEGGDRKELIARAIYAGTVI